MLSNPIQLIDMSARSRRALPRHGGRTTLSALMLGLLGAACGQRYELGEVVQPFNETGAAADSDLISALVASGPGDADAVMLDVGTALVAVGDVDGDGYADWLGARAALGYQLTYGGPRGTGGTYPELGQPVTRFCVGDSADLMPSCGGGSIENQFSRAEPAGDIDGDGYADIFFSTELDVGGGLSRLAPMQRAYLWYGGPNRPQADVVLPRSAVAFGAVGSVREQFQTAVANEAVAPSNIRQSIRLAAIGDIDSDGYDDFAYSYWFAGDSAPESELEVVAALRMEAVSYLFYGGPERLPADGLTAPWAAELANTVSASALGDIDGDGYADFIASQEPPLGASGYFGGAMHVLRGGAQRLAGGISVPAVGSAIQAPAGAGVQGVGDLDRDGRDDFLVSQIEEGHVKTFLFYGDPVWASVSIDKEFADAAFALPDQSAFLSALGDWNGDGSSDLLLEQRVLRGEPALGAGSSPDEAAWSYEARVIAGTAARYSGTYTTVVSRPELEPQDPEVSSEWVYMSVLGDVDGDGFADIRLAYSPATPAANYRPNYIKFGGPLQGDIH
jgi:hypothetical protein